MSPGKVPHEALGARKKSALPKQSAFALNSFPYWTTTSVNVVCRVRVPEVAFTVIV